MVRLQAMNLSRPILKLFYISIAIGGYISACSVGARGSLDLRTSSANVISVQCGYSVVQLFRFADPSVKTEWGEPKALLKVADKEFIGTLTEAGFHVDLIWRALLLMTIHFGICLHYYGFKMVV